MIYCVWYPSGGFGHFINAVLTLHGVDFARPKQSLKFASNGNSHNLDLIVPKYFNEYWGGNFDFKADTNYCVLIDNGINSESQRFKSRFPTACTIKICYSDMSWPVVARTMIDKAMDSSLDQQLPLDAWNTDAPWARREKYFLFLRDHDLRYAWRPSNDQTIYVDDLFTYENFFNALNDVVLVENFQETWTHWRNANSKYIDPVQTANRVISYVQLNEHRDLSDITDVWTQAVVYYYIWLKFGIEVPHNDFADFFSSTEQIIDLVS